MDNIDLDALFDELNEAHFNNEVPKIPVNWNNRLRTTAGRCFPRRIRGTICDIEPYKIDLANRLFENNDWDIDKVKRTLVHEMVHAWLYEHYNERGHTPRFHWKMSEITGEWGKNHRCHSYDTTGLREERNVEIICESHGLIGHRRRMPNKNRTYHHSGCGHSVSFRRKQTVATGGISLD
jgi:predicted SprT family Zn-dependent metalloprotease